MRSSCCDLFYKKISRKEELALRDVRLSSDKGLKGNLRSNVAYGVQRRPFMRKGDIFTKTRCKSQSLKNLMVRI